MYRPKTSILLDCGEGTVGQICRFYGNRTEDVIRNIKALFITHMHGDHHMGVMELIRTRQKYMPLDRPVLILMAPQQPFDELLNFYEENFGDVRNEFLMINNEDLVRLSIKNIYYKMNKRKENIERIWPHFFLQLNGGLSNDQKDLLKIKDLQTCRVPHLDPSYAISLKLNEMPEDEHNNEFKLTFSGDTIPCDALVELGQNSTLLIHEATFEDSLASSAAQNMHSTISQAIQQSEKMNAKYTILTHFSKRYGKLPPINDELIENKNIGIAFDNMEIVADDLSKLNSLYFKLKEIYADELGKMEKRSVKYASRNMISELRK